MRLWRTTGLLVVMLLGVLFVAGCDRRSETNSGDVQVDVEVSPQPLEVGPAQVTVMLRDANDKPIENAAVEVEGNMSHAGMVPVIAEATGGDDGRYVTQDFEFTMAGEWFIIVRATLPDGRTMEQTFDLQSVAGAGGGN
ncbi:MAG: hypothetical protein MAG451_03128 [Anaerolineales bacterium]|nr:hypothetical protein [Anaerolineales bacterium]